MIVAMDWPDPSLSYILKAHLSFSSGDPLAVMSVAIMNSWPNQSCYWNKIIELKVYLEVNAAVSIFVKYPENLIHKDLGIASGENHGIHLEDLVFTQLTVWAVLLESSVREEDLMEKKFKFQSIR